jgi:hypothetical protein
LHVFGFTIIDSFTNMFGQNLKSLTLTKHDKGSIATTPNILPPPYVLKLGQFCFEVPPKDDVKPNFCTPPMEFHVRRGPAAKDI